MVLHQEIKAMVYRLGIQLHQFLDDFNIWEDFTWKEGYLQSQQVIKLVKSLGWGVNFDKSESNIPFITQ